MNSATPLLGRTCLAGRDIALRCPRRVQRRNCFECRCRWHMRSARYYAGGDGAARRPYHRAKHIPGGRGCPKGGWGGFGAVQGPGARFV